MSGSETYDVSRGISGYAKHCGKAQFNCFHCIGKPQRLSYTSKPGQIKPNLPTMDQEERASHVFHGKKVHFCDTPSTCCHDVKLCNSRPKVTDGILVQHCNSHNTTVQYVVISFCCLQLSLFLVEIKLDQTLFCEGNHAKTTPQVH